MAQRIKVYKYQGAGNDFVIIDNRDGSINLDDSQIRWLCDRRFGVGADGMMLLGAGGEFDFTMRYFNSDGFEVRCVQLGQMPRGICCSPLLNALNLQQLTVITVQKC